jgi:chromosome segregation ATPase
MALTQSIIETGVDKLVDIINSKGRISSLDAAKELGVSNTVILEWADFLEEEGIISINYKFTKPYLIARKVAKKDTQLKAKEFTSKKDVFVRKAEVSLSFLEKESKKLSSLKDEFDKIKKDLGIDITHIKDELKDLERYEKLKLELDEKIEEQKNTSLSKLQEFTGHIADERNKYKKILTQIRDEEKSIQDDKKEARSLEESERIINKKLAELREVIKGIEKKAEKEEVDISNTKEHIKLLEALASKTESEVKKEKEKIEPIYQQSQDQTKKIEELQKIIINKLKSKEKEQKGRERASKKMKEFFKKKIGVIDLIEKVNSDRDALQKELIDLIKKAKSFQLTSKSSLLGDKILAMEKKFNEVDQKKKVFENEMKKLGSFFK